MEITELLRSFVNKPGLCSLEDVKRVKAFLMEYNDMYLVFCNGTNTFNHDHYLEHLVDKVDWYIDHKTNTKKLK